MYSKTLWERPTRRHIMTVNELIEVLETVDGESTVMFYEEGFYTNPTEISYDEEEKIIYL